MRAANFTRQVIKPDSQWKVINGLGYTDNVLQMLPLVVKGKTLSDPDSIKMINSFAEYAFYTFTSTAPVITIFTLPTHELNNFNLRYAVSIDDGPLSSKMSYTTRILLVDNRALCN